MLRKILEKTFRYYGVYKLNVSSYKPILTTCELNKIFEIRQLTFDDLTLFKGISYFERYRSIYKERFLSENYLCFGVINRENNDIAYYSWVFKGDEKYIKEIYKKMSLKKLNAFYFEDDNTIEKYRGLKLHTYVMQKRIEYTISQNKENILIIIHPKNIPALKTIINFGFKRINIIPYYFRREFLLNILKR